MRARRAEEEQEEGQNKTGDDQNKGMQAWVQVG